MTTTPTAVPAAASRDLLTVIRNEIQVLHALIDTLRAQRGAVVASDPDQVDETTDATEQLITFLKQADAEREALSRVLTRRSPADPAPTLSDLEDAMQGSGSPVTGPEAAAIRAAIEELRGIAQAFGHEVATNRELLLGASAQVADVVHTLYGAQRPAPTASGAPAASGTYPPPGAYGTTLRPPTAPAGAPGVLINRTG